MQAETSYGNLFINRLIELGKQRPFNYADLVKIRAMSREELAERLRKDCPDFSEFILQNSPEDAATLVHERMVHDVMRKAAETECLPMELLINLLITGS